VPDRDSRLGRLTVAGAKSYFMPVIDHYEFFDRSQVLLGASGLFFAAQVSGGGQVSERTTTIVGISWALVPMIIGPIGLLLGIFGKLAA
jgi:hypothetical protein